MHSVTSSQKEYPASLKQLKKHPQALYITGESGVLSEKCIAVIGTRKVSDYGRLVVLDLVPALVELGYTIVSGLAPGIDSISHETAILASGSTIGVLGFGFNYLPSSFCRETAKKIAKDDGSVIVSPFQNNQKPAKWTFIERNKIIAGLASSLIVIEAPIKSGTSYTVNCMLELGREVYAVPGSIFSYNSKGTHALIKAGATLLDDIYDVQAIFDK